MVRPILQRLAPAGYRNIPWKNGGGVLTVIAQEGAETWHDRGVAWHYGRTSITAPGPFSDLSGYERLQVVIGGRGLVLLSPEGEIDLRRPFRPMRYDGGTPIRTHLENGPVEVANLIADRSRFAIDLTVLEVGPAHACAPGIHLLHAAAGDCELECAGEAIALKADHAVRLDTSARMPVSVTTGRALVASVHFARE